MTNNTDPAGLSSSLERVSEFLLAHYAADNDEGRDGDRAFAWVAYDGATLELTGADLYAVLNAAVRIERPVPTVAEPTVQVPVLLIERAHAMIDTRRLDASEVLDALAALISQPNPTAEPDHRVSIYPVAGYPEDERLTIVAECTSCGRMGTWPDSAEGNGQARAFADLHNTLPTAPPRIEDMAPGTTFTADRIDGASWTFRWDRGALHWHGILGWLEVRADTIDPSTIRDVTPPSTESTK